MTAAKSRSAPKFVGELNEPIFAPLDMSDDGRSLIIGEGFYRVFEARIRKMTALAKHCGVKDGDGFELAYKMACDLVPGFQVLYDDPQARALKLPGAYYGTGTKPKGAGEIPEVVNGAGLIWMFSLFERAFPTENEPALAERVILCMKPDLAGIAHKRERAKLGKTLRNRLGKARRAAAAERIKHPIS